MSGASNLAFNVRAKIRKLKMLNLLAMLLFELTATVKCHVSNTPAVATGFDTKLVQYSVLISCEVLHLKLRKIFPPTELLSVSYFHTRKYSSDASLLCFVYGRHEHEGC